jgi:FkbM family methyltransferase
MTFAYKVLRRIAYYFNISFSFSSDGEDYILLKIFENIHQGNYIDIGSNHPVLHSNTFSLYLRGWRGVCIDPLPFLSPKYKYFRTSDKFYNSGFHLGNTDRSSDFYYFPSHPDNSTFDRDQVKLLQDQYNRCDFEVLKVSLIGLDAIISNFTDKSSMHLVSIDVEGLELEIIKEFIRKDIFPWVFCVEELSYTLVDIKTSEIYEFLINNGYVLISRTFLSSVYILKSALPKLINNHTKIWNVNK